MWLIQLLLAGTVPAANVKHVKLETISLVSFKLRSILGNEYLPFLEASHVYIKITNTNTNLSNNSQQSHKTKTKTKQTKIRR